MKNKNYILIVGIINVFIIAFIDHITGNELDVSILYLIPVAYTVWIVGIKRALPLSIITIVIWEIEQIFPHLKSNFQPINFLNMILRLLFFVFAVFVISRIKKDIEIEKQLSRTDFLTGILNRRAFFEVIQDLIQNNQNDAKIYALIYFDIDNFKKINDTYGHRHGDAVILKSVEVMNNILKNYNGFLQE